MNSTPRAGFGRHGHLRDEYGPEIPEAERLFDRQRVADAITADD